MYLSLIIALLVMKSPRSTSSIVATAIVWLSSIYFGLIDPQHYSVDSILKTTIDDGVFGGEWQTHRHVIKRYFSYDTWTETVQEQRLELTLQLLNVTIGTLNGVGLQAFLDAGTLLGYHRDKKPIPWDIDGDVGIFGEECMAKYPDQSVLLAKLRSEIPYPYHVENFNCEYPPKDGRDFTGIITDTRNGFKIDIFTYNVVDTSADSIGWRRKQQWLQRDDEKSRYNRISPRDSLLPLQWGNFSGVVGYILPRDVETHLKWDFGAVLDAHLFPFRLNMEVSISVLAILGVLLLVCISQDLRFTLSCVVSVFMLAGGLRVIALIVCVGFVQQRGRTMDATSLFKAVLANVVLGLLILDLSPVYAQSWAMLMEMLGIPGYTVNPDRYCLFYKLICIDG